MQKLPEVEFPLPVGMRQVSVIEVSEDNGSLIITFQKAFPFGICPGCGTISQKIKDRHLHQVIDRPIFENNTTLQILKRRWKCQNDLCEVNTFTETVEGLPRKWTHTTLFYRHVYQLSRRMTYTEVCRYLQEAGCRVSLSTVYQKAQQHLRQKLTEQPRIAACFVGLDEFSKGKKHNYGVVLVDLEHNKVIDVADGGKTQKAAASLLLKLEATKVKACCLDMWQPFVRAVKQILPQALVVIDRFHVIKEANAALDKVRKRVIKSLRSKKKKEVLKAYKELLLMGLEKLSENQQRRLGEILIWNQDLCRAYELKELLRAIYAGQNYQKAQVELDNWIEEALYSQIAEMEGLAETVLNWRDLILNYWIYRISNAVTEGKINKIKTLRRKAYNYNSFQNLRMKILEQEG